MKKSKILVINIFVLNYCRKVVIRNFNKETDSSIAYSRKITSAWKLKPRWQILKKRNTN